MPGVIQAAEGPAVSHFAREVLQASPDLALVLRMGADRRRFAVHRGWAGSSAAHAYLRVRLRI